MRKSALLILTLGLCTAVQTSAQHPQQHRMMLPTQNIDFSSGTPVTYSSPGSTLGTGGSDVSNGAHGPDGKLLFYVNSGHVINRFGSDLGPLVNHVVSNVSIPLSDEVVVVPIPYTCKYYVIYTEYMVGNNHCNSGNTDAFSTFYAVVDMGANNGEGAIIENGEPIVLCDISATCSKAVRWLDYVPPFSPPPTGMGAPAVYQHLYRAARSTSGDLDVIRYDITDSDINNPTHIITIPYTIGEWMSEMDISEDGTKLVMSNAGGSHTAHDVFIVHLNGSGLLDASAGNHSSGLSTFNINSLSTGYFVGQEFSLTGNYLYVAHTTGGIYRLTLSSSSVSTISGTSQFGNSQLEMSYHPTGDHKILTANSSGIGAIVTPEASTPTFDANYIPGAVAAFNNT